MQLVCNCYGKKSSPSTLVGASLSLACNREKGPHLNAYLLYYLPHSFRRYIFTFLGMAAQFNWSKLCWSASFRWSQFRPKYVRYPVKCYLMFSFLLLNCFSFPGLQHWWRCSPTGSSDVVFGWKLTTVTILSPTIYRMADVTQLRRGFHAANKHNLIRKDSHVLPLVFNAKDVFLGAAALHHVLRCEAGAGQRKHQSQLIIWDRKQLNWLSHTLTQTVHCFIHIAPSFGSPQHEGLPP